MDNQKQSIVDRINQATNILVTVSANPSVDQLAACVGLTIALNEAGKHATAVFSGAIPSTIEFLKPEKTIEKNTDSLRDFIIALDKSKADKLRYKVEDKVVKIFITPYRTSISDKDLEFSQGDFNVEVVVCLGVHDQKDLDQAITAHGRILHDATVISINTTPGANLGALNWVGNQASSLSEMVASIADEFGKKVLDNQIATAFLTGIVAETERFSNNKTTPETMSISAKLMTAGANQQLVATELQAPPPPPEPARSAPQANAPQQRAEPPKPNDGTLRIEHSADEIPPAPISEADIIDNSGDNAGPKPTPSEPAPEQRGESAPEFPRQTEESQPAEKPEQPTAPAPAPEAPAKKDDNDQQIHIDDQGQIHQLGVKPREFLGDNQGTPSDFVTGTEEDEKPSGSPESSRLALTPPTFGGTLTDSVHPEALDPATDPLSMPKSDQPLLRHDGAPATPPKFTMPPITPPSSADTPLQPAPQQPVDDPTKNSAGVGTQDVHQARSAVQDAAEDTKGPIAALNALPLGAPLHEGEQTPSAPVHEAAPNADSPADKPLDMPLPPTLAPPPASSTPPTSSSNDNPSAPPPVPPPMMPPFPQR